MKEAVKHPMQAIRRAAVPLVVIETADPAASILGCIAALNGSSKDVPIVEWDIVNGWRGRNQAGNDSLGWYDPLAQQLPETLKLLGENAPKGTLAFLHGVARVLERDGVVQGIWNLRDSFKAKPATLVMVGASFTIPAELSQDVVVITEPLPDAAGIRGIVDRIVADAIEAGAKIPAQSEDYKLATDTLLGLSAFAAEQALAMSVSKTGLDLDGLWERKRRTVEQTPGLSIWRPKPEDSFDQLAGLVNLKTFLGRVLSSSKTPIRAIGFIDEIEKGFAGSGGDLSGVSQDQLLVFLKAMQDYEIPGLILVGPGGTGKSAIAKASGSVARAEVLTIDTGAMTGSLVGESQRKIRAAMEVFRAVSQGKGLFIATCNKIGSLPPELRRRFTLGTFFVDLPTPSEQRQAEKIWKGRYGLAEDAWEASEGWTGAEIKACCDTAYRTGMTCSEASCYVVPVCKSGADTIEALRKLANGNFISASVPGTYVHKQTKPVAAGRALNLG